MARVHSNKKSSKNSKYAALWNRASKKRDENKRESRNIRQASRKNWASKKRHGGYEKRKTRMHTYPEGALPAIKIAHEMPNGILSGISGEKIQDVYTALYDSENKQMVSFSEAVEIVKRRVQIREDETIVYSGAGTFAVIGNDEEDTANKKKRIVKRKVNFEDKNDHTEWREDLRYGLTMSYTPNPLPLKKEPSTKNDPSDSEPQSK